MIIYITGFFLGLSLILAIGSQNVFVLKQGIKNQHIFLVCAICSLSDAILILFGVGGFGAIVKAYPVIEQVARYGGFLFLTIYALLSFKTAFSAEQSADLNISSQPSLRKTVAMCLAFTWLNPHVYLDTVVLLGSVSTQHQPDHWVFALGACTASFVFFFSLGFGARVLAPFFEKPKVWKVLDFFVGIIMLSIAISLLVRS